MQEQALGFPLPTPALLPQSQHSAYPSHPSMAPVSSAQGASDFFHHTPPHQGGFGLDYSIDHVGLETKLLSWPSALPRNQTLSSLPWFRNAFGLVAPGPRAYMQKGAESQELAGFGGLGFSPLPAQGGDAEAYR